jgi:hypothetical protein
MIFVTEGNKMMKKLVLILGACVIMGTLSGCNIKKDVPVFESVAEIAEETQWKNFK